MRNFANPDLKERRLVFFIPTLCGGGAERVVSELSCNMPGYIKQYLVLFENKISYPHKAKLIILNASTETTKNLLLKFLQIFVRFIKFKKITSEIRPDIVLSFLQANTINSLVMMCSFRNRFRAILSERTATSKIDLIINGLYGFINRSAIKFLYNRADRIISVSEKIKKDLSEIFKVKSEKIEVIYNPLDLEKINRLARQDISHSWFTEGTPIIINIGRLTTQKNHFDLLKAFQKVRKEFDCRLVIIGDGELEAEILKMAEALNIAKDFLLMGFQNNPFKFISRSTIFVLPSLFEGFPNVLAEAMAVGCPVLASDCVSGPREILCPDIPDNEKICSAYLAKYGILFPVGDIDSMCSGIKLLLSDNNLRIHYGNAGKERVEDFQVNRIVNSYLDVFNNS